MDLMEKAHTGHIPNVVRLFEMNGRIKGDTCGRQSIFCRNVQYGRIVWHRFCVHDKSEMDAGEQYGGPSVILTNILLPASVKRPQVSSNSGDGGPLYALLLNSDPLKR